MVVLCFGPRLLPLHFLQSSQSQRAQSGHCGASSPSVSSLRQQESWGEIRTGIIFVQCCTHLHVTVPARLSPEDLANEIGCLV